MMRRRRKRKRQQQTSKKKEREGGRGWHKSADAVFSDVYEGSACGSKKRRRQEQEHSHTHTHKKQRHKKKRRDSIVGVRLGHVVPHVPFPPACRFEVLFVCFVFVCVCLLVRAGGRLPVPLLGAFSSLSFPLPSSFVSFAGLFLFSVCGFSVFQLAFVVVVVVLGGGVGVVVARSLSRFFSLWFCLFFPPPFSPSSRLFFI